MNDFAVLVLSLPTRNSTLRMRLWRALKQTGCVVLRDGVYVLPASASGYAALSGLESDIHSHGGLAMTLELKPRTQAQLADLRKRFDRGREYGAIARRIGLAKGSLGRLGARPLWGLVGGGGKRPQTHRGGAGGLGGGSGGGSGMAARRSRAVEISRSARRRIIRSPSSPGGVSSRNSSNRPSAVTTAARRTPLSM